MEFQIKSVDVSSSGAIRIELRGRGGGAGIETAVIGESKLVWSGIFPGWQIRATIFGNCEALANAGAAQSFSEASWLQIEW